MKRHPDSKVPIIVQKLLHQVKSDIFIFIGSYLSGTQLLVWMFRVMGAQIGRDVILPDEKCLTDPHLTTIGHHVRLHRGAHIQVSHDSIILFTCITISY